MMNSSFQKEDFDKEMLATSRLTNQMLNICFQGEDFDEMMATIDPESVEHGKDILTILGFVVILIILELLGNGFLYGIFVYEKFGIDTKRRTMINMLVSQVCLAHIFKNIFAIPFWIYGFFVSPDGILYALAIWTFLVMVSIVYFSVICSCQIMLLKYLYLTKWPTMALLDDYFLATFVGFLNILISVLIMCIRIGIGVNESNVYFQRLIGKKEIMIERTVLQKTVFFW